MRPVGWLSSGSKRHRAGCHASLASVRKEGVEMRKDLFDHRRIFDARDPFNRTTTVLEG